MLAEKFDPTNAPTTNRPLNKGLATDENTGRLDAVAKVTGQAKYGRDRYLPNSLFVGFVRCPFGAADLASFDEAAAAKLPGVVEVSLKSGKSGQYHGQNVGHVVAESPLALRRALRALKCVWKRTPAKSGITDDDCKPEAVNDETAAVLKEADFVLDAWYGVSCNPHSCLETHGTCVDHRGDSATVYSSTQGTFAARDGMDDPLGLPRGKWELVCEFVGGGFGSKLNGAGKEGLLAAQVAAKYKRPAYCFCNRKEDQLDTGNRPSGRAYVKLGAKKDGTITGGLIHIWGGNGVSRGGGGISFPRRHYNLGSIQRADAGVTFNAGGPRPFRAPGAPPGAYIEELVLDELANGIGMDPVALRVKLDKAPDRREMFEMGAKAIGWDKRLPTGSQKGPMRRGFGCGGGEWHLGGGGAGAQVIINRDGSVESRTGTQDPGTGQRTIMGIAAASALGVPLNVVTSSIARSSFPVGPASGGSQVAAATVPSMESAAEDARTQFLQAMAKVNGGEVEQYDLRGGELLKGGKPFKTWKQACAQIPVDSITGNAGNARNNSRGPGHSQGVQFAEVEVDCETGQVFLRRIVAIQSCGRVVCRKTAESQIIGGVIQGLSYALFEDRVIDRQTAAVLNPNLEAYKLIGPKDMPHIDAILFSKNFTRVCPLGEPTHIPTAGAVACAIFNAIGRPVRSLPMTPDKVLAALEGGAA
ncbi:MAG: xanthine dehydrogenase family protein molybdopterin-binding subunit [Phycisphaerales bacterium]